MAFCVVLDMCQFVGTELGRKRLFPNRSWYKRVRDRIVHSRSLVQSQRKVSGRHCQTTVAQTEGSDAPQGWRKTDVVKQEATQCAK